MAVRLYPLAYAAAGLPLATIHLTYLLSVAAGSVEWCLPHIHSCTSISATGREPPAYFVFKGMMIPAAVLLILYWWLSVGWLRGLNSRWVSAGSIIMALGLLAGVGLIFYSTMLGAIGELYSLQRHIGVVVFFGCGFFAQLLITAALQRLPAIRQYHRGMMQLSTVCLLLLLGLALMNVLISMLDHSLYKTLDNALAWNFAVLLCLHVMLIAEMWRRTEFGLRLQSHSGRGDA